MTWVVIVAVGLGSYLFRVAPLALLVGRAPSEQVDRLLGYASNAALAALIVSSIRQVATTADPAALVAVAAGVAVAFRGGSMPRVVATGIATHALLALLTGTG